MIYHFKVLHTLNPFNSNDGVKFHLDMNDYHTSEKEILYTLKFIDDKIEIEKDGKVEIDGVRTTYNPQDFGLLDKNLTPSLYYHLNSFAGGRLVIYNNDFVEFTIYGSGLPIIFSVLGQLEKSD